MPIIRNKSKWVIDIAELRSLSVQQCLLINKIDDTKRKVMLLHQRMAHASTKVMIEAIRSKSWSNSEVSLEDIETYPPHETCIACIMGKSNKSPIPKSITNPRDVPIGQIISGDIVGPITPSTKTGDRYFYLFVDRRTSFLHVFTAKTKDGFITSLREVYNYYKQKGYEMKGFRSDSENIMVYGDVPKFLASHGVNQTMSLPYAHFQNLIERHVQTVVKGVTTLMHAQQYLDSTFWNYALFHFVSVRNDTPNSKTDGRTPRSMIEGEEPLDLGRKYVLPFGCPCATTNIDPSCRFDSRRDIVIYVGHSSGYVNGGLVFSPSNGSISDRHDLIALDVKPEEFNRYSNTKAILKGNTSDINHLNMPSFQNDTNPKEEIVLNIPHFPNDTSPKEDVVPTKPINIPIPERFIKKIIHQMKTRSMNKTASNSVKAYVARLHNEQLTSALSSSERDHWIEALKLEVNSLLNVTTTIIPEIPDPSIAHDVIYTTVVLKRKMKDPSNIEKYKVRICACGNQLVGKLDYMNETYSPTVGILVHAGLLQLAVYDRMHMATFDTVAAYLYEEYPSDIKRLYLRLPKIVSITCGLNPDALYRVKKYLYGLPDAGRAYYLAYSTFLQKNGYKKSQSDPCLFVKLKGQDRTYVWLHVDDTFVASTSKEELTLFQQIITTKYRVTANYDVTSYLGIDITNRPDGSIKLTQSKLLHEIISEYGQQSDNHASYPAKIISSNSDSKPIDTIKYLRLLGKLMYLVHSRPDITTAISYAATKTSVQMKKITPLYFT